jgi:hypothetical protein
LLGRGGSTGFERNRVVPVYDLALFRVTNRCL